MRVFTGYAGGKAREMLRKYDMGCLVSAPDFRIPEDDLPWAIDNGAFPAFVRGEAFPEDEFGSCAIYDDELEDARALNAAWRCGRAPSWGVAPDKVGGGRRSLAMSLDWIVRLPSEIPWLLAVQEGMTERAVRDAWWEAVEESGHGFRGFFVGGKTLEWKWASTEATWLPLARELDAYLHVGRVSSPRRLAWADRLGVDSVDSTAFAAWGKWENVAQARRILATEKRAVTRQARLAAT